MTSFIGGVTVILPAVIFIAVFTWVFNFVTNLIQPLTDLIVAKSNVREVLADVLVLTIIVSICFMIGLMVRTRLGNFLFNSIEHNLLRIAPGYNLIKDTVLQLLGSKKSPFSTVALAQIFENDTLVTCFVTDEHADGSFTVFVPTGPNPTSGVIYHLKGKFVHPVNVSVEEAMRSIISCGAGSTRLVEAYKGKKGRSPF